jgi:hypothetical protein
MCTDLYVVNVEDFSLGIFWNWLNIMIMLSSVLYDVLLFTTLFVAYFAFIMCVRHVCVALSNYWFCKNCYMFTITCSEIPSQLFA